MYFFRDFAPREEYRSAASGSGPGRIRKRLYFKRNEFRMMLFYKRGRPGSFEEALQTAGGAVCGAVPAGRPGGPSGIRNKDAIFGRFFHLFRSLR